MKYIKALFSEKSDISMMRVLSLISLAIGATLALKGMDTSVSIFVYSAFAGKAVQKYFETVKPN